MHIHIYDKFLEIKLLSQSIHAFQNFDTYWQILTSQVDGVILWILHLCTLSRQLDCSPLSISLSVCEKGLHRGEYSRNSGTVWGSCTEIDWGHLWTVCQGSGEKNRSVSKRWLHLAVPSLPFYSRLQKQPSVTPVPWTMSSCRCRVGRGGRADSLSENPFSGVLEPPLPSLKGGGRFPAWTWRSCSKSLRAALMSQFFPGRRQSKKWNGYSEYRETGERHKTITQTTLSKLTSKIHAHFHHSPVPNFLH